MRKDLVCILKKQTQVFLDSVTKKVSIDNRGLHMPHTDYPVLLPDSLHYDEYVYYREMLEWYIRDYLITGIITKWLKVSGKKCYLPKYKGKDIGIHFSYSNSLFGRDYPFAFIIEDENIRIGVRYSSITNYSYPRANSPLFDIKSDLIILSIFKKYQVSKIITINWEIDQKPFHKDTHSYRNKEINKYIDNVRLLEFLNLFFSYEESQFYINGVRNSISEAYKIIGYQTIPNLSLKHLSYFKNTILHKLNSFNIKNTKYIKFSDNGDLTSEYMNSLYLKDYNTIYNRCYNDNLLSVLTGKSSFARCFITSEHLFEIYQTDNQNYFDYSTVVSGYFKSVELLLEDAVIATLTHPDHEDLWITAINIKGIIDKDIKTKGRYKHIRFKEAYKDKFKTDMGSLISFLHNNQQDWRISDSGEQLIHNCLVNYNKGCRNEHLHKDIINDIETVKAIRNNTIICLLYLLGGYIFYEDSLTDIERLGGNDKGYNRFYTKIKKDYRYDCFYIQYNNQEEKKAIILIDQPPTEYDEFGDITTGLEFAIVDSFLIDDYAEFISQIKPSQKLTINKDNIPEKIYWYNPIKKEKTLIKW